MRILIERFIFLFCIAVLHAEGRFDISMHGTFLYWQPTQDNIELGQAIEELTFLPYNPLPPGVFKPIAFNTATSFVQMDFDYKPGFKIGMGIHSDPWELFAEYTWLHGTDRKFSNGGSFGLFPNMGDDLSVSYVVTAAGFPASTYGNGKSTWHLGLDLADLVWKRPFPFGASLILSPLFGLRAAWIHQRLHGAYFLSENNATFETALKSRSWGIGPKAGIQGKWTLIRGFRFFGNGAIDLLFTRYDLTSRNQVLNPALVPPTVFFNADQQGLNLAAKTHAEMELGLGWSSASFDFSLGYDFQIFFNQNMFRNLIRTFLSNGPGSISFIPNGNLCIQGLMVKTRCDY